MSILDFYNKEEAIGAIEESEALKKELLKEIKKLDTCIFILKYFIETGESLDPEVFGIKPEDFEDE